VIRVVIAEDHNLVRKGLRALLEQSSEFQVIGEASNGYEAIERCRELQPDVLVMDLAMPRMDGAQAAEHILAARFPTQIVILSMHSDSLLVHQLLRRGIKGYLLKDAVTEELTLAVRSAVQGRVYISPTISDAVMELLLSPQDDKLKSVADRVTLREREVLQLIAEGQTNVAVAGALNISVKTVEKHRANLMSKLEVNDLASLIRVAVRYGLIFQDP
jgi:DNA-binding NarL/FixJ family response regulator